MRGWLRVAGRSGVGATAVERMQVPFHSANFSPNSRQFPRGNILTGICRVEEPLTLVLSNQRIRFQQQCPPLSR